MKFESTPPICMMGGTGIGTRPETTKQKFKEDLKLQFLNETNIIWKIIQVFNYLYRMNIWPILKKIGLR